MELLELAIEKLGSVAAVARYLKVTPPYLFQVRAQRCPLAPHHAGRLAELLERNPTQAVVDAMIAAAGNAGEAANLRRWFRGAACTIVAACVAAGLSGFWMSPASASSGSTGAENPPERLAGLFNASMLAQSLAQGFRRFLGLAARSIGLSRRGQSVVPGHA